MKKTKLFLLVILGYILASCDPADGKLLLINESNDTIYFIESAINKVHYYPIVKKNNKIDYLYSNYLIPLQKINRLVPGTWENYINESCEDNSVTFFFFSKELINSATEDSIMKYQLYTKKKVFKVKDLEKLNWTVTYP